MRKHQSKTESFVEANVNTAIGFGISLAAWVLVVVPVWDLPVTTLDNLAITGFFTVISVARGYLIRRFFERYLHALVRALTRFVESRSN